MSNHTAQTGGPIGAGASLAPSSPFIPSLLVLIFGSHLRFRADVLLRRRPHDRPRRQLQARHLDEDRRRRAGRRHRQQPPRGRLEADRARQGWRQARGGRRQGVRRRRAPGQGRCVAGQAAERRDADEQDVRAGRRPQLRRPQVIGASRSHSFPRFSAGTDADARRRAALLPPLASRRRSRIEQLFSSRTSSS